jgi:ArsR family transcriptional regulator
MRQKRPPAAGPRFPAPHPKVAFAAGAACLAPMAKKPRPLTDEALAMIARRFAVLGEPMRLRLVHALFDGEKSVGALVKTTKGTQTNVSRHLQTLAEAGLLARRREGLQVIYAIADPSIFSLCELVCGSLEKQHARRAGAFAPDRPG